jgi:hypothetical protein
VTEVARPSLRARLGAQRADDVPLGNVERLAFCGRERRPPHELEKQAAVGLFGDAHFAHGPERPAEGENSGGDVVDPTRNPQRCPTYGSNHAIMPPLTRRSGGGSDEPSKLIRSL